MKRDLEPLTARTFDVLIVGGGIYGLTIACDAAQRGLSVALIEGNDFGSGSSFNHLRTIHGGLRYLQALDVRRARESIRARRTLAIIAPAAVEPLAFALPLTRSLTTGRLAMRAGFLLDAALACDRNAGVPALHRLPAGRVISRAEALRRFPELDQSGLTGAAVWHDYITTQPDRLTLAWGLAAAAAGAILANYVKATGLLVDGRRVAGARVVDTRTGRPFEIAARATVNATGGAVDELLKPVGLSTGIPMLKAMNLVTRRPGTSAAVGGRTRTGRNLFMVPWRNRSLFGTWESAAACVPHDSTITSADVAGFIRDINLAFPTLQIVSADVTLVHRGVVPGIVRPDGSVVLDGKEQIHDHARSGAPGMISVVGTKYTTARGVAEKVTSLLMAGLRRPAVPCRTAITPLPISTLTGDDLLAEAARSEMVVTLEDAVVRRTPLGSLGCPADETLVHAASIVGDALGWSQEHRTAEIAAVRSFYQRQP